MTGTTPHTCQTIAEAQAALATTSKAAAIAADAHFTNNDYLYASSETFYLRSYELFTQELTASHFMVKAMLSRLNKATKGPRSTRQGSCYCY
jgi:hypothetical protein